MSTHSTLHLALVGSGGDGVMVTAHLLLRTAAQLGFYGMMTQSYGPQIRGGEAAAHVTIGTSPVRSVGTAKDMLVCFRFADLLRFQKELHAAPHALVVHGVEDAPVPAALQAPHGLQRAIPFTQCLEGHGLPELTKNMMTFGLLCRALQWPMEIGMARIEAMFAGKSAAVRASNLRAFEIGYRELAPESLPFRVPSPSAGTSRTVLSGNEACAHGAVAAGCRFFAGYPITPSSEILETIAELLPAQGGHVVQAEDEIASLGMVIGASYGGIPAMTATSGPGLSLMTEMMGLASMAEIPIVIVDCQRAGPATGMPSRTEQSDLWHAMYGGHGDFPRVIVAPTDVTTCQRAMFRAFYCAEKFQLPALVLSDANIAQRAEIIDPIDISAWPRATRAIATRETIAQAQPTAYQRFDLRAAPGDAWCGVSPMAVPGTPGGMHSIAGIEHTTAGMPSADGELHEVMNRKRFRKFEELTQETALWFAVEGAADAPHAIITWGSSAGIAREYAATHPEVALFIPEIIHPFPVAGLQHFLKGRRRVTVLEMNYQGQLFHHLRGLGAIDGHAHSMHRSGGLPFQLGELTEWLDGHCREGEVERASSIKQGGKQ